ncbi:MAG TPA: universal stress protein [Thermodesulfobacteriota bacterium]|nr:universal stress protein [Thermodesulfobacteriota bacterium]
MTGFKKILLVYSGKENGRDALERAFSIAKHNKSGLTIVWVVERIPERMDDFLEMVSVKELEKALVDERLSEIKNAIKKYESRTKIKAEVKVLTGKPQIEIIREVLRNKHDLVIKTAGGKGRAKDPLLGSVDIGLLRKCPSPVWMLKPSRSRKYSRILAAIDPDPTDQKTNELNGSILELALSVSKHEKSELHIVHAWSLFGEKALRGPRFGKSEAQIKKLLGETRRAHKECVETLLAKNGLDESEYKLHLLKGDPSVLIPKFAAREKMDLVVMGTVCRTGLPGFIIGNTAESVLSQVKCSLLTVKPAGFVSPVKL